MESSAFRTLKISLSTNARDWETPLVIQIYSFDHLKTFLNEKYGGTVSELYYFNKSYNKLLPLRNLEELALNDIVYIHVVLGLSTSLGDNLELLDPIFLESLKTEPVNGFDNMNTNQNENFMQVLPASDGEFSIKSTLLRNFQVANRNISPALVVNIPREIVAEKDKEVRVYVVTADPPYTEINGAFSVGNILAVNGHDTITFRSLKFSKKRDNDFGSDYRAYRIKVCLPDTKYNPIYSRPFILLSNPTKQRERPQVREILKKYGLGELDPIAPKPVHTTKHPRTEDYEEDDEHNESVSISSNWSSFFNTPLDKPLEFFLFLTELSKKLNFPISDQDASRLYYFFENMPETVRPKKTIQSSKISYLITYVQWDILMKYHGPPSQLLQNLRDIYSLPAFHGFMKSSRANELLKDQPGFYLIRYSESEFLLGNYAISVNKGKKDEDDIKHFTTQNLISEPGFMFNNVHYINMRSYIEANKKILQHPLVKQDLKNIERKEDRIGYIDPDVEFSGTFSNLKLTSEK